jgi:hypothetical protein
MYSGSLAAITGDGVFNFGEVVATAAVRSLAGTPNAWLGELLQAFNRGDIDAFNTITADNKVGAAVAAARCCQCCCCHCRRCSCGRGCHHYCCCWSSHRRRCCLCCCGVAAAALVCVAAASDMTRGRDTAA